VVIRVIIVEDDIELRDSLADYLTTAGHSVTAVGGAIELYQEIGREAYDVALVDVNLPYHDGLSIATYLARNTTLSVIVMTVKSTVADRVAGYEAGADLYLVKPVACEELHAAIVTLHRRRLRGGDASGASDFWTLERTRSRLVPPGGAGVELTRGEMRFIERLALQQGSIVTRVELNRLMGYDGMDADSRALNAAVSRLRVKVQAACGTALPVQTVQGEGYVLSVRLQLG
jgi:two-component system OmpR family response regulator